MVSFATVSGDFNTNWNTGVIAKPGFTDMDLKYSAKYPHNLFFKMYQAMPIKPITQTSNAGYVRREQLFEVHGIYATYADVVKAAGESKRIITEYDGWYVQGKANITQTKRRFVFKLPCIAREYLQKSEF